MRPFISLLLIICIPLLFLSVYDQKDNNDRKSPAVEKLESDTYCNSRFNFCAEFPSELLPIKITSANGDGIILKNKTGDTQATINGPYNVTNWHPDELFSTTIDNLEEEHGRANILFTKSGDDYYETFFTMDNYNYFNRSFFINDYYVSLLIKVPVDEPLLMEQLREKIKVDYRSHG